MPHPRVWSGPLATIWTYCLSSVSCFSATFLPFCFHCPWPITILDTTIQICCSWRHCLWILLAPNNFSGTILFSADYWSIFKSSYYNKNCVIPRSAYLKKPSAPTPDHAPLYWGLNVSSGRRGGVFTHLHHGYTKTASHRQAQHHFMCLLIFTPVIRAWSSLGLTSESHPHLASF